MRILFTAAVLALSAGVAVAACDPGERVLSFHHTSPDRGSARGEAARALADRVNFDLNGRACMQVVAEADDHTEATVAEALREGRFDFAAADTAVLGAMNPRFRIYDLPFLFDGIEAVLAFDASGTGRDLLGEMAGEGLVGLAHWLEGFEQIAADRMIARPADAADLTFAATGSPVEAAAFEALRASYIELSRPEVAFALRDGVISGQTSSFSTMLSEGLDRVLADATQTDHTVSKFVLLIAQSTWEGLEPTLREDLSRIVREVSHERNRLVFELNEAARIALGQRGLPVRRLSDPERLAWKRAMQPVWFAFGGDIGFDQIATAIRANRRRR